MLVKVTQDDIDKGKRKRACFCPVALALNRDAPRGGWSVSDIMLVDGDGNLYAAPINVSSFVMDFDRGLSVQPFEFELNLKA